jgi:hypothetical protein
MFRWLSLWVTDFNRADALAHASTVQKWANPNTRATTLPVILTESALIFVDFL